MRLPVNRCEPALTVPPACAMLRRRPPRPARVEKDAPCDRRPADADRRLRAAFRRRARASALGSQRLVAYFALRDRPLLRIHVAGTLWLHSSENRSYANLRTALWRLGGSRHAVVEATSSHVGLSHAVVVDVRRMAALARGLLDHPEEAGRTRARASWTVISCRTGTTIG